VTKLMNPVIMSAFVKSTKKAPTIGTTSAEISSFFLSAVQRVAGS